MARLVALFDHYDSARRAALALTEAGRPARVTYLMAEGDQSADGAEGFYPGTTPGEGPVAGDRLEPGEGLPFSDFSSHRFAVTGTDSLAASPSLEERLRALGLSTAEVMTLLERVARGEVAAVFRLEGDAEKAMAILAGRGATQVQQVF